MPDELDTIADALYALPPEDFVPARDDHVAAARERGDRDLAKAVGRLRRPTRPAWLANLLARHRGEQLDGLISLAAGLAQAQRTLDGSQLRALSSQRNRAVAAMAREAGRLAQDAGSPASDAQLRELQGILEAALAQPDVAREVRAGRLTRTLSYSGFGPQSDPGAVPVPAPHRPAEQSPPVPDEADERRRAAERAERRRALEDSEREAAAARERQEADEATRDDARDRHAAAREHVARLTAELEVARDAERSAGEAERAAAAALRESTRAANAAAAEVARARARADELS